MSDTNAPNSSPSEATPKLGKKNEQNGDEDTCGNSQNVPAEEASKEQRSKNEEDVDGKKEGEECPKVTEGEAKNPGGKDKGKVDEEEQGVQSGRKKVTAEMSKLVGEVITGGKVVASAAQKMAAEPNGAPSSAQPKTDAGGAQEQQQRQDGKGTIQGATATQADGQEPLLLTAQPRRIHVMRHSQRLDTTLREVAQWTDNVGSLRYSDLNAPQGLPRRRGGFDDYLHDTSVTRVGLFASYETGVALGAAGVRIGTLYSSPFLRCLQTSHMMLKGYGNNKMLINIEPGLTETPSKGPDGELPHLLSLEELEEMGFPINRSYAPLYADIAFTNEERSAADSYRRHLRTVRHLLQVGEGDLLLIGHAGTLDQATRMLVGKEPRSTEQLRRIMAQAHELSMATVEEKPDGTFQLVRPPIDPYTIAGGTPWDHNALNREWRNTCTLA